MIRKELEKLLNEKYSGRIEWEIYEHPDLSLWVTDPQSRWTESIPLFHWHGTFGDSFHFVSNRLIDVANRIDSFIAECDGRRQLNVEAKQLIKNPSGKIAVKIYWEGRGYDDESAQLDMDVVKAFLKGDCKVYTGNCGTGVVVANAPDGFDHVVSTRQGEFTLCSDYDVEYPLYQQSGSLEYVLDRLFV